MEILKEELTVEKIEYLIRIEKKYIPKPKVVKDGICSQMNYTLKDKEQISYILYTRQSEIKGNEDNFSCGLSIRLKGGENFTLTRYNGSNHQHKNPDSKETLDYVCHVHKVKESYLKRYGRADKYAEATEKYKNLDGALNCIIEDCNIKGISNPVKLF